MLPHLLQSFGEAVHHTHVLVVYPVYLSTQGGIAVALTTLRREELAVQVTQLATQVHQGNLPI